MAGKCKILIKQNQTQMQVKYLNKYLTYFEGKILKNVNDI